MTTTETASGYAGTTVRFLTAGILVLIGIVTALPVLSVFSPNQLSSYNLEDVDPSTLWLLQHRGVRQFRWRRRTRPCGPTRARASRSWIRSASPC